jgi:hypothetical protein
MFIEQSIMNVIFLPSKVGNKLIPVVGVISWPMKVLGFLVPEIDF